MAKKKNKKQNITRDCPKVGKRRQAELSVTAVAGVQGTRRNLLLPSLKAFEPSTKDGNSFDKVLKKPIHHQPQALSQKHNGVSVLGNLFIRLN